MPGDIDVKVVFNRLPRLSREMEAKVADVVKEHAFAAKADMQAQMAQSKSGHWYGKHQASAPGEAPAIDTSELVNSLGAKALKRLVWIVWAGAEYAIHLEYGTVKMAARPFMRPAAERISKPFFTAMRRALGRL